MRIFPHQFGFFFFFLTKKVKSKLHPSTNQSALSCVAPEHKSDHRKNMRVVPRFITVNSAVMNTSRVIERSNSEPEKWYSFEEERGRCRPKTA